MCVYKKDGQGRAIEWPGWGWAELELLPGPCGVRRLMAGVRGWVCLLVVCGVMNGCRTGQALCAQGIGPRGRGRGALLRSWRLRSGLRPVLRLCFVWKHRTGSKRLHMEW